MNIKELKVGDVIYYIMCDEFTVDTIKEIVEVDGEVLITPETYPEYTLTKDLLLDETNDMVKGHIASNSDCLIKLSDARKWLLSHLTDYLQNDGWGDYYGEFWTSLDEEKLVYDFCKEMYYNNKKK